MRYTNNLEYRRRYTTGGIVERNNTVLTQKAVEIAKKKHPEGFNKQQLIECGYEVYDGFATDNHKKIKTLDDIYNKANAMSEIDGHYPRGMSNCFVVGINGGCGIDCPVFTDGDCEEPTELLEDLEISRKYTDKEKDIIKEKYL